MQPGDPIQYFDEAGTNRRALVTAVLGADAKPLVSLITVIDGQVVTRTSVPHRDGRLTSLPPREVKHKRTGRVISVISGERKREPGDFWFE